mmetsp:Transcript_80746/g.215524  ORF Transcript_80746/g.215524 Transcript_80746/m.215524 type:complete len:486 (+) Transcript_80746:1081-2538(+)
MSFFQTGTDEHGAKIAEAAVKEGIEPIQLCDKYVDAFRALNQRLRISSDQFMRTTFGRYPERKPPVDHYKCVQEMWKKCRKNGDIYLEKYSGYYLVREERYVTDQEAEEWGFKDPNTGNPLTKMEEDSFFFKLGSYRQKLLDHFRANPTFVQPESYKNALLRRLEAEGDEALRDLSISRGTFDWGVPCPEDPVNGKNHVMYVWMDALTNYLSGVNGHLPQNKFWPADAHVIGKDIIWFHAVIWPAFLMSAGYPLPKSVVVHGFIAGPDGRKMSKSYGNVVNPHDELDVIPADSLRWYLCREAPFGSDLKFVRESMQLMHNSDLNDTLGNLVNRAVNLSGGAVPAMRSKTDIPLPFDFEALRSETENAMQNYWLNQAAKLVRDATADTNKWIADLEPWKMKDPSLAEKRADVIRLCIEAVYILAHFFAPFTPIAADAIFKKVGAQPRPIADLTAFRNLKEGDKVESNSVLFQIVTVEPTKLANGSA